MSVIIYLPYKANDVLVEVDVVCPCGYTWNGIIRA